jgi:hypothetical protein
MAITDLSQDLITFGTSVQNNNAGISASSLKTELEAAITGQLAAQAGAMALADIGIAISLALKQLNPPATTGNDGVLAGGNQTSAT